MTLQEIRKEREELEKKLKELIQKENEERMKAIHEEAENFLKTVTEKGFNKVDLIIDGYRIRITKVKEGRHSRGKVLVDGEEFSSFADACRQLGYTVNGDSAKRVLERHGHVCERVEGYSLNPSDYFIFYLFRGVRGCGLSEKPHP